jgi:histidinol-phosphatase
MTDWGAELTFANHLADKADEISMRYFRGDLGLRTKKDGSPVTQADEEIESMIRSEITAAYPDHGILGEEEGETAGTAGRRWVIDPIDGTKNYSWGIRNWGTLIAHEVDGEIVCGVASAPALNERYAAARGYGATRNGDRISVSQVGDIAEARIGFTSAADHEAKGTGPGFRRLLAEAYEDRGFGDFYGHMLVAAGSLDVMVEATLKPWDMGPLIVIVEEAGGRFTSLEGDRTIYGGNSLSTNGVLHEAVRSYFRSSEG